MNVAMGARLASAPPQGNTLEPAGPASPEAALAAGPERRTFMEVLQEVGEPLEEASSPEAPATAEALTPVQLAALAALLGQTVVVPPVSEIPSQLPALSTAPAVTNTSTGTELAAALLLTGLSAEMEGAAPALPEGMAAVVAQAVAAEAGPEGVPTEALEAAVEAGHGEGKPALTAQPTPTQTPVMEPTAGLAEALPGKPQAVQGHAPTPALDLTGSERVRVEGELERGATEPASNPAQPVATAVGASEPPLMAAGAAPLEARVTQFGLGEPARLAEAQPMVSLAEAQAMVEAVTQTVTRLVKNGETGLRMQLQPEGLGRIELQISHQTAGVHVALVAEVTATAGLLDQHLGDLRQALTTAGVSLTGLTVGDGWNQQRMDGQPGQQGASGQAPASPGRPTQGQVQAVPALGSEPRGLVDYWI